MERITGVPCDVGQQPPQLPPTTSYPISALSYLGSSSNDTPLCIETCCSSSRSAESFPDFRLFWVDFVPWWCGVVCVLGSRHALYSIKSGVVAPLGWGGARYLSQHTRHPPELSKGLFKPLNQGHAGQEHTSTDKHTIILTYWACYRANTLKSANKMSPNVQYPHIIEANKH